jgi:hypothetical protein
MRETNPARLSILWSTEARADLRAVQTAIDILHCVDRYLRTHSTHKGDVKKLKPPQGGFLEFLYTFGDG